MTADRRWTSFVIVFGALLCSATLCVCGACTTAHPPPEPRRLVLPDDPTPTPAQMMEQAFDNGKKTGWAECRTAEVDREAAKLQLQIEADCRRLMLHGHYVPECVDYFDPGHRGDR